MKKKKKIKIGSFVLTILFVGLVIYGCYYVVERFSNSNDVPLTNEEKDPLEEFGYDDDEILVLGNNLSENEIKQIDKYYKYITDFSKNKYFVLNNISRYETMKNNSEYGIEEIIMRVNMNLDYDFYTHTEEITDAKNTLVLVNKYYHLPAGYEPEDLVTISGSVKLKKIAADNYKEMLSAASNDGVTIYSLSGYRSEDLQTRLYNNYVKSDGVSEADTYSARPSFSEHQTGLAMDVTNAAWINDQSFENTDQFRWLIKNSYKYGFVMRYPKGKEYITGYMYEPWHYRYVGVEAATIMYNNNLTFEEYYVKYLTTYE